MSEQASGGIGDLARRAVVRMLGALRAGWLMVLSALGLVLQVIAAPILLFEEWGWRPLVEALAWLSRFKVFARIERAIVGLPPYGALVALAVPTSLLFPLKLLAVYLVAQGKVIAAGLLFIGAKIASTALIARVYLLVRPALMRIGWFAYLHDLVMPWKDALFVRIRASWAWRYGRMVKTRVRHEVKQAWQRLRPSLVDLWSSLRASAREAWARLDPRAPR